jgi:hypothetical protein
MSLAPSERRTLAGIEDALRNSEPRLAAQLTRFALPASRTRVRQWKCWARWRLWIRDLLPTVAVLGACGLLVSLVALFSHSTRTADTPRTRCGVAAAGVNGCWPAGGPSGQVYRPVGHGDAAVRPATTGYRRWRRPAEVARRDGADVGLHRLTDEQGLERLDLVFAGGLAG